VLANERTFSAWLRTALSAIGVGLAVPRLLAPAAYRHIAMWIGLILILVGVAMGMLAAKRYCTVARELKPVGIDLTPAWVATVIVAALTLVGALAAVLVVME
jgi:putative membrane protein